MVTVMISTITYNVHLIKETVVDLVLTDQNAQIANVFRMLDSLMILSKMHQLVMAIVMMKEIMKNAILMEVTVVVLVHLRIAAKFVNVMKMAMQLKSMHLQAMVSAMMKLILETAITMALTVALLLSTQKLALLVIAMVSLIAYVFLGKLIKVVQVVSTSGTGTQKLKSMSFHQYS